MKIRPQDPAVDPFGRLDHVMMVVPVNTQIDKAQYVGEKCGKHRVQSLPVCARRNSQFEHENRNKDGNYTIAESFEPCFAHGDLILAVYLLIGRIPLLREEG